jgi:hypothetical protein
MLAIHAKATAMSSHGQSNGPDANSNYTFL